MNKIILTLVLVIVAGSLHAQDAVPANKKFMQITTVESVISGGLGRSKMIVTNADGTQTESDMENLFSMVGINFKNIKENENQIVRTLKTYTDDGWKLDQVIPFALSPSEKSSGIFLTRYLLSKTIEK